MKSPDRVKELLLEAAERPTALRDAYLREACAGDGELEREVRALLAAHGRADDVLGGTGVWARSVHFSDEFVAGARVGPYRLIDELGEGGFGTVWRAEQEVPVRRAVALKVLKVGLDTREVVSRFAAERQALALMDHPGIARVFDGGATERGRPWFAMELVNGERITDYCDRRALGVVDRVELFLAVCRAVQHAHQKGVIHRDIKPSNVLVAEVDGRPVPKVIDFGIAKATGEKLTPDSLLTRAGQVVGTPAYMSPEQVGEAPDIDTRADVYSLGVLLYELLSGARPFEETTLRAAGVSEMLRLIREVDPPKPSSRLGGRVGAAAATRTSSRVLARHVRGDLDWIVMRCLEKDRERRYDSVAVLATELERHLRGEPVLAGPPSVVYRLNKLVRRNRAAVAFLAVIFVLLVAGIAAATGQRNRALAAERQRSTELARADAVAEFLEHVLLSIDPAVAAGADATLLRRLLDTAGERVAERDDPPEVEADLRHVIGGAYFTLRLPADSEPHFRRAVELREGALGDGHPDTVESLHALGVLLVQDGRLEEADSILARAAAAAARVHGPDAEETLTLRGHHATAIHRLGRNEEAAELLLDLEERLIAARGAEDPGTLEVTNNLADTLEDLGRYDEAEPRYARALEVQLRSLGGRHPRTLMALNNLGSLYMKRERWDDAEPLLLRSLAAKREILAPDHPSVLITLNNLAELRKNQGRFDDAEEYLEEALELGIPRLGAQNHLTLQLRVNLARLYLRAGRDADARDELAGAKGVECVAREALGDEHAVTRMAAGFLVDALLAVGDAEEAEARAGILAVSATELPAGDPGRAVEPIRHGLALAALGRDVEALAALSAGLDALPEEGQDDWRRRARAALADLDRRAGRPGEAVRHDSEE